MKGEGEDRHYRKRNRNVWTVAGLFLNPLAAWLVFCANLMDIRMFLKGLVECCRQASLQISVIGQLLLRLRTKYQFIWTTRVKFQM